MANHFLDNEEDTDARWVPLSDEEWDALTADLEPGSDTEAGREVDEWLEPAATVVRRAPVEAARPAPRAGDTAAAPRVLRRTPRPVEEPQSEEAFQPDGSSRPPRAPRARRRPRHGCLSALLWLVMLGVLALMALRFLPAELASGRAVPELISFVPWLFAPILLCLVLALLWRRLGLFVVSVLALATMLWWHAGFLLPRAGVSDAAVTAAQTVSDPSDNVARIMTLNTANGGASAEEVVALVRDKHVEVLCMQELTDSFLNELAAAGLYDLLPHYVISDEASAISNGGRNGIWTLAPMSNASGNLLPIETSSMPAGTVRIGNLDVRVVSVHPNSPVRGAQDLWDEGLDVIGQLSGYNHSYLIMGDFNSTWDHAQFRDLLGVDFVDAGTEAGEGFHMTYPSGKLPSLVEIDHIVYWRGSGVQVSDLETAVVSGTDHRALLGVLEV